MSSLAAALAISIVGAHCVGHRLAHEGCRYIRFGLWYSHSGWCGNHRHKHGSTVGTKGSTGTSTFYTAFAQAGAKTFSTGTGAVTLNGAKPSPQHGFHRRRHWQHQHFNVPTAFDQSDEISPSAPLAAPTFQRSTLIRPFRFAAEIELGPYRFQKALETKSSSVVRAPRLCACTWLATPRGPQ